MAEIEIDGFEDVSVSQFTRLDPGSYMMSIPEKPTLETADDGKKYFEVKMRVVDGPEQQEKNPETGETGPVGLEVTDRYYLTAKAYWRIKKLLVSCGIIARDDTESDIAKGKFDLDIFVGCKFPCAVGIQMNNGKEYRQYDPVI